jgi:asparagine N-glycosylation enzyme membrane subunit Stt3
MAISLAVFLAFIAGFVVRSFLGYEDADLSTEIERHYGDSRFHGYD